MGFKLFVSVSKATISSLTSNFFDNLSSKSRLLITFTLIFGSSLPLCKLFLITTFDSFD